MYQECPHGYFISQPQLLNLIVPSGAFYMHQVMQTACTTREDKKVSPVVSWLHYFPPPSPLLYLCYLLSFLCKRNLKSVYNHHKKKKDKPLGFEEKLCWQSLEQMDQLLHCTIWNRLQCNWCQCQPTSAVLGFNSQLSLRREHWGWETVWQQPSREKAALC